MDQVVFIMLIVLLGVVMELIKKAQKKPPPPVSEEERLEAEQRMRSFGRDFQDLIAEELGLNLERRPRVQSRETAHEPELRPGGAGHASQQTRSSLPASGRTPRVVYPTSSSTLDVVYPKERGQQPKPGRRRGSLVRRGTELPGDRRRAAIQQRREALTRSQQAPLSLEERALAERGQPVSLEVERTPEDHERFHARYGIPQPAGVPDSRPREVAPPRPAARRSTLPDRPNWSFAQKAIIWAEILDPPKGLIDE